VKKNTVNPENIFCYLSSLKSYSMCLCVLFFILFSSLRKGSDLTDMTPARLSATCWKTCPSITGRITVLSQDPRKLYRHRYATVIINYYNTTMVDRRKIRTVIINNNNIIIYNRWRICGVFMVLLVVVVSSSEGERSAAVTTKCLWKF